MSSLLREKAFVDGAWVGAASGKTFEVCKLILVAQLQKLSIKICLPTGYQPLDGGSDCQGP